MNLNSTYFHQYMTIYMKPNCKTCIVLNELRFIIIITHVNINQWILDLQVVATCPSTQLNQNCWLKLTLDIWYSYWNLGSNGLGWSHTFSTIEQWFSSCTMGPSKKKIKSRNIEMVDKIWKFPNFWSKFKVMSLIETLITQVPKEIS